MSTTIEQWERADVFERENYSEKKTQNEMILEYLHRFGEISPIEALSAIGCFRLAARISDLRADGHRISREMVKGKGSKSYAIYRLEDEDGEV